MKNFVFCVFISFFLACCSDPEKPSLPDDYWGEASAERNGKPWITNPACWIDRNDNTNIVVQLDSFIDSYYLKESLIILGIPPFLGTYKVHKATAAIELNSSLSMWDADFPIGGYILLEADSNTNLVTLASYDTLSKEVKGTFNLTYVFVSKPFPDYPDTLRFKNGKFHGKILN